MITPARSAALVLIAVLVSYANALPNGFVYDDWDLVVRNPVLRDASPLDLFRTGYWESTRGGSFYYRPIVSLSYWIDWRLWGERPSGYHLTNVLLHAAASLLLLALARRWLRSEGAALACAAIFAVHPVHTQSATWIAGRTDLLAAVFFLLALLLQQKTIERGANGRRAALLQVASLVSLVAALLSKEMAATYPAALALHATLAGGPHAAAGGERRGLRLPRGRWAIGIAAAGAIAVAWLLLRAAVVGRAIGYADDPHAWWTSADGTASRLLAVPSILAFYLRRILFPWWLGFESGLHPVAAPGWREFWMPVAGIVLLVLLAFRFRRRDAAVPFGVGWFLVTIVPIANVLPIFESAMEHFAYLPSAGLVAAAVAFSRSIARSFPLSPAAFRRGTAAAALAAAALLGARTIARNQDWRDEETFWRVTVRDTPSARAWNNLGLLMRSTGRLDEAGQAFVIVAALEPRLPSSWANLGAVAAAGGKRDDAIALFRRALVLDPAHADALYNLALVLETNGGGERYGPGFSAEEAMKAYRDLLAAHPEHAEGWTNYGVLLEKTGRSAEAAAAYGKAIAAASGLAEPHAFLAAILYAQGDRRRAASLYRRYLELAPAGEYAEEARARSGP